MITPRIDLWIVVSSPSLPGGRLLLRSGDGEALDLALARWLRERPEQTTTDSDVAAACIGRGLAWACDELAAGIDEAARKAGGA